MHKNTKIVYHSISYVSIRFAHDTNIRSSYQDKKIVTKMTDETHLCLKFHLNHTSVWMFGLDKYILDSFSGTKTRCISFRAAIFDRFSNNYPNEDIQNYS